MRQSGDAPRSARAPRKARRPVALGPGGERDARLAELGKAFDVLVQALSGGEALAEGLARRCHDLWLEQRDRVFEWRPTEIRAAGKSVLAADARSGRFILDAYAAGLRALAIREHSGALDVLRLARELAALATGELSAAAFSQRLFGGGWHGFDVALAESAEEIGAALTVHSEHDRAAWLEQSSRAVASWNEASFQAGKALAREAIAARFLAPLECYERGLGRAEFVLDAALARTLSQHADDPGAWASAETALWLEQPQLRAALPVNQLSFRAREWIEGSERVDQTLFARLEQLLHASNEEDPDAPIDQRELGIGLARKLLASDPAPATFVELARRIRPELLEGMLAELGARAAGAPAARAALAALLRALGSKRLFEQLELSALDPELGVALLSAALDAKEDPVRLVPILIGLPVETLLAALTALPSLCAPGQRALSQALAQHMPRAASALPGLIAASAEAAAIVGSALLMRHCADVPSDVLRAALSALVQRELGATYVMPLWEARGGCSNATRLLALRALALDPRLLTAALGRRAPGLNEAPEIREAIEELQWNER